MASAEILAFLLKAFEALPGLISAGVNIAAFVSETKTKVDDMQANDRAPTQQEWDDLNQKIADLRNRLHSP